MMIMTDSGDDDADDKKDEIDIDLKNSRACASPKVEYVNALFALAQDVVDCLKLS